MFGMCLDQIRHSRKMVRGRRVSGTIRSLVNAKDLQTECARVLYETLLVPVHMYGNETMLWRDLELELHRWTTSENC